VAERVQFGPKAGGASSPQRVNSQEQSADLGSDNQASSVEEIPTINIDDEIKPEDLPF